MLSYVFEVIVYPGNFDGPEEDRKIGTYSTRTRAVEAALDWIAHSSLPHPHGHCACTWKYTVRRITLNSTTRAYGQR